MKRSFLFSILGALFFLVSGLHAKSIKNSEMVVQQDNLSFKLHKKTEHFIDIEVSLDQVWIGCSDADLKSDASYMLFLAKEKNHTYEFFYRRPSVGASCLKTEKEYLRMVKGAKKIRLVGAGGAIEKVGPQSGEPRVPRRFKNTVKTETWFFARLQAGKMCKAYFEEHCELPENYWAGMVSDLE